MNIFLKFLIKVWPAMIISLLLIITIIILIKNNKNQSTPIIDSIIKNKMLPEISNDLYDIIKLNPDSKTITDMIKNEDKIEKLSNALNGIISFRANDDSDKDILDMAKKLYLDPEQKDLSIKQKVLFGWITFWIGFIIFLIFRMILFSYNNGILIVYSIFIIIVSIVLLKKW